MSDRDRLIANPGRTEIERVRSKHIEIKDVGTTVKIRDEIHARTNHYIKQSKPSQKISCLPTSIVRTF